MAVPLISVSDEELDDLRGRLRRARWPAEWPGTGGWDAGTDPRELRRLADYWAAGYDWRKHEAEINALPSRFADIDGTPVHYLRFDAERPGALPIILTHGWPSSVLELAGLARASAPGSPGRIPRPWPASTSWRSRSRPRTTRTASPRMSGPGSATTSS